jgi:hypothetical protein
LLVHKNLAAPTFARYRIYLGVAGSIINYDS